MKQAFAIISFTNLITSAGFTLIHGNQLTCGVTLLRRTPILGY